MVWSGCPGCGSPTCDDPEPWCEPDAAVCVPRCECPPEMVWNDEFQMCTGKADCKPKEQARQAGWIDLNDVEVHVRYYSKFNQADKDKWIKKGEDVGHPEQVIFRLGWNGRTKRIYEWKDFDY